MKFVKFVLLFYSCVSCKFMWIQWNFSSCFIGIFSLLKNFFIIHSYFRRYLCYRIPSVLWHIFIVSSLLLFSISPSYSFAKSQPSQRMIEKYSVKLILGEHFDINKRKKSYEYPEKKIDSMTIFVKMKSRNATLNTLPTHIHIYTHSAKYSLLFPG